MPKGVKKQRDYAVIQSNQFVRYIRHNSAWNGQTQRGYYFLASLIKQDDEPNKTYHFKADYMRKSLGMSESGTNYSDIKDILKDLRDKSQWIRNERGKLEVVSILQSVEVSEETGETEIQFHRLVQPHLFNLQERYTRESLGTLLTFDCKYTSELYLFLLSFFNENHQEKMSRAFSLKEIKERLSCEYNRWPDIKRFVIDKAVNEINQYSLEMRVDYEPIRVKNKTESLIFTLKRPTPADSALTITQRKSQENYKKHHKQGIRTEETKRRKKQIEKAQKETFQDNETLKKVDRLIEQAKKKNDTKTQKYLEGTKSVLKWLDTFEELEDEEIRQEWLKEMAKIEGSAPPEGSETK